MRGGLRPGQNPGDDPLPAETRSAEGCSAGRRAGGSHGATPRTSRILGGCVHQVNTCVVGQESVYRSGGIVQGVNAGNGEIWLFRLNRGQQSKFQLLITVDRFHDDCLDEVVKQVFVYAPCRHVVTHVFHFSKEAVGAVQVAV